MQKKLYHYTLSGILFTSILGMLSHFLYEWSENNLLVGLFMPVNESVWEHIKLLFFPMLLYFLFEKMMLEKYPDSLICANTAALLIGTALIPTIFYTYSGILGKNYAPLDIATFYVSVILAFLIRYKLSKKRISKTHCRWLTALVLLILVCFFIFTFQPPDLGIFRIPDEQHVAF